MSVLMREKRWPEYAAKKDHIIILPVGSTEQHAQHLPLCVDAVIAESFAKLLAERVDGLVMPPFTYGYKSKPLSGGGPLFPGTIDLSGATLTALTRDVLLEVIRDGFTKIFILNAHFENEAFLVEAMDIVNRETGGKATIVESNWWDPMDESVIPEIFDEIPFPGWALEHAALTETSLMLYFAPELVHMEDMVKVTGVTPLPYYRYPLKKTDVPASGGLADATSSSAARGKKIVDSVLKGLVKICEKELK